MFTKKVKTLLAVALPIALAASVVVIAPASAGGTLTRTPGQEVSYKAYGAEYANVATTADGDDACSWYETSKKDYSGKTLRVLTHAIPNMGKPTALHAKQFEELTGGKVEVEHVSFGDLYAKQLRSYQTDTNQYDVVFNGSYQIGDFHSYYAKVPDSVTKGKGSLATLTPLYKELYKWDGETKLFGIDADRHFLKYRTDVYENAAAKAFYKSKTGKELAPPKTWKEYNLHAKTFNGYKPAGQPAGLKFSGTTEITQKGGLMFGAFIDRVAPYAKNPNVKGGFWFDENMVPQVNNPGFVAGLTDFVEATKFMPVGGKNFDLSKEIESFGRGDSLLSYTWDDAWSKSNEPTSPIKNKVKAAPLPGAEKVWNRVTKKWDTPKGGVNYAPYIAWGWSSAVTAASPAKAMAFDYLCFWANKANHKLDLTIGDMGVNPSRTEDFTSDFWVKEMNWGKPAVDSWLGTMQNYEKNTNRVFDLRVPGVSDYMTAMENAVAKALAGQATPQKALDEAAKEWNAITKRVGITKVKSAYQNVIALEDNIK